MHFPCHEIAPNISLCAPGAQSSETPVVLLRPQAGSDLGSGRTPHNGAGALGFRLAPVEEGTNGSKEFHAARGGGGSQGLPLTTCETDAIWGLLGLRVTDTAVSGRKSRETTAYKSPT